MKIKCKRCKCIFDIDECLKNKNLEFYISPRIEYYQCPVCYFTNYIYKKGDSYEMPEM